MSEQPRYDGYEESSFFRDGMVLQRPPDGTIPRGAVLGSALADGRAPSGAQVVEVPYAITPELLAVGRSRFQIFCAVCHGAGGYGGSIVASNMVDRRPPSLRTPALARQPVGFLYGVIRNGFGWMPPYAAELSVPERWAVVTYLRRLQQNPSAASPDERADSVLATSLETQDSAARVRKRLAPR